MTERASATQWVIPDDMNVSKDELQLRVDIYNDSIFLTAFDENKINWTRMVSADEIAATLNGHIDFSSGLLPQDTLWWKQTETGHALALWRPPQVWPVALQEKAFEPPIRLRLPMPGLVFVCAPGRSPWVFAAKDRPSEPAEQLFRAPTFNVFNDGRVCPGNHQFPAKPAEVPESFFQSFFSKTGDFRNRSVKYPDNLIPLWQELNGENEYPLEDLVPQCTVGQATQIPNSHRTG